MSNEMIRTGGMELSGNMKAKGAVALAFQSREMIETLGMMQMAKMDPRDMETVRRRLQEAAKNETLAVAAEYIYVKGGTEVAGLSIRAAEALSKAYGNVDFGMREVEVDDQKTVCQAYCWDLETNTRQCEFFTVPHSRSKGVWEAGRRVGTEVVKITDQRELDEITRSRGARIKRGCILAVIPIDVQEEFAEACNRTLAKKIASLVEKKGETGGIREVVEGMLKKLEESYGVTRAMVCDRFQRKSEADLLNLDNRQIVMLFRILTGLRDGIAVPSDYFKGATSERASAPAADAQKTGKEALRARLKAKGTNTQAEATDAPQAAPARADAPSVADGAGQKPKEDGFKDVLDLI